MASFRVSPTIDCPMRFRRCDAVTTVADLATVTYPECAATADPR
jgi:hypothetical protein